MHDCRSDHRRPCNCVSEAPYTTQRMAKPQFKIGQIVRHTRLDYRGVVVDADLEFGLTEQWYQEVAKSQPPKDQPWYRVLVHGGDRETYVAELNLAADTESKPVKHARLDDFFDAFRGDHYARERGLN